MLVDNDLGLTARRPEAGANEIHFSLYHGEIILSAALQDESGAERGEIRNAGHVEEDIFGENGRKSRQNFFGAPALPLEVDDIGLHEDRAAVAEHGHGGRRKRQVGILLYFEAEA